MPRYRGPVEQARKELREQGSRAADARKYAPRVAQARQEALDRETPPFSWAVGGPAIPQRGED